MEILLNNLGKFIEKTSLFLKKHIIKVAILGIIINLILELLGVPTFTASIRELDILINYHKEIKELKSDYSMLYSKIAELESKIESMESLK